MSIMIIFPVSFPSKPPFYGLVACGLITIDLLIMSTLGWVACGLITIDLLIMSTLGWVACGLITIDLLIISTLGWVARGLITIDLLITWSEVVVTICILPDVVRRSPVCYVLFKCVLPCGISWVGIEMSWSVKLNFVLFPVIPNTNERCEIAVKSDSISYKFKW